MMTASRLALVPLFAAAVVHAQPCPLEWSSPFSGGDFDSTIKSMIVFDDGSGWALYAAGGFTRAGGSPGQGVAKWTGTAWEPVGGDFDADVNVLAAYTSGNGTHLYAGGNFHHVGTSPMKFIARWTGSNWVPVGSNPTILGGSGIRAMTGFTDQRGTALWVGGHNLRIGTGFANVSSVLRWDGINWTRDYSGGQGLNLSVSAMAVFNEASGSRLYVGGISGYPQNGLVRSEGQSWGTVGPVSSPGVNGQIHAMAVHNDGTGQALYIGGDFTSVAGVAARNIARWNGSAWSPMGVGADAPVFALGSVPGSPRLSVGGAFSSIGGVAVRHLAQWNGLGWSGIGNEQPNDAVRAFASRAIPAAPLYVGGSFSAMGSIPAARAAVYSLASGWSAMDNPDAGDAPSERVRAMTVFDADGAGPARPALCVGGDFRTIGALEASHIASWDGSAWSALGGGVNGPIFAMTTMDAPAGQNLIIGGRFNSAGGAAASNIARWDGDAWSTFGAGLPSDVKALAVFGASQTIHAAGLFPVGGGPTTSGVARWDGTAWIDMGPSAMTVNCLEVFDDGQGGGPALYAAGEGITTSGPYRWTGSGWLRAGTPPWPDVPGNLITSMAAFDDGTGPALYVAGVFQVFNPPANYQVARWKGGVWTFLPSEPFELNLPLTLKVHDDGQGPALYIAGLFTTMGGASTNRIARWTGTMWAPLGTGIDGPAVGASISALATFDDDGSGPLPPALYAGGSFVSAGGRPAPRLARWTSVCACYANCDGSTAQPILNVNDFVCFQQRFAAGDPYANCDGSTAQPVLNVNDFVCFQQRFAAGCP